MGPSVTQNERVVPYERRSDSKGLTWALGFGFPASAGNRDLPRSHLLPRALGGLSPWRPDAGEPGTEPLSQSRKHDIPCYQWEERLIEKCV